MAIPVPTIPSSTVTISAVELKPTQNNKAFYCYSGEIGVTTSEITMISVNDIGKRDILFCMSVGSSAFDGDNYHLRVKNNGVIIFRSFYDMVHQTSPYGYNELKLIIPANTSLEVTLQLDNGTHDMIVSTYGYYLEYQ